MAIISPKNRFLGDNFSETLPHFCNDPSTDPHSEIISALGTQIDEFITGVGTGACFSGNAEWLKQEIPGVRRLAIEPLGVRALSGSDISGTHQLEGIDLKASVANHPLRARTHFSVEDCNKKLVDLANYLRGHPTYRALAFIDP